MRESASSRINKFAGLFLAAVIVVLSGCSPSYPYFADREQPYSCDITIIGGSVSGIIAALEASRNGAKVIVIVNDDSFPENLADLKNSIVASGTKYQGFEGREFTDEDLAEAIYNFAERKGSITLQRLLVEKSAEAVDWLSKEAGITYSLDPENAARHLLTFPPGTTGIIEKLTNKARQEGVIFFDPASLKDIQRLPEYQETTINYRGKEKIINSRAVILADGGFIGTPSLMELYGENVPPATWRTGKIGEGISWAFSEGIDTDYMNSFLYYPAVFDKEPGAWIQIPGVINGLLVSKDAVVPLAGREPAWWSREEIFKTGGKVFLIIEESLNPGEKQPENIFSPVNGITAFQERYSMQNPFIWSWLNRPDDTLWVTEVKLMAQYCLGGLSVNQYGLVKKNGQGINGIYAVGEITGGIHGPDAMPGTILLEAIVFGRLVGDYAARRAIL